MDTIEAEVVHKPSLGDPAVVDALVRQFARRVFDTRAAFHKGEPGAREPLVIIEEDARSMGAIFLGHDPAYDATPWNSDNRLGMYFKVLLPEEDEHYGGPGVAVFMWLAHQLAQGAKVLEDDPGTEAEVQRRLNHVIEDVVARLLHTKH
ncbi:hypothetical protein [Paraburkholderia sediminicola]|uniref:hypothetical protein n=1 Tax=Paraburkholderia sediminicola TaxID=458836 RepID=UPI0038B85C38